MEKERMDNKTAPKGAAVKTGPKASQSKKAAAKKSGPASKKPVAKKKAAAKKKPVKKRAAKPKSAAKSTIPRKKKPDLKSLLLKRFDRWAPENPYYVPSLEDLRRAGTPPSTGTDQKVGSSDPIKALLFKTFDLSGPLDDGQPGQKQSPIQTPVGKETQDKTGAAETVTPVSAVQSDDRVESRMTVPDPTGSCRPPDSPVSDPIDRVMKFFVVGLVLLILILIGSSYSNTQKYYIRAANGDLEIWRGNFAPMGQSPYVRLIGVVPPPSIKTVYTKSDAFGLAFSYYFSRADGLIEVEGVPDFEKIRSLLSQARQYTLTKKQQNLLTGRLSHIDLMMLIYKAEVAAAKGAIDSFNKALTYLEDADRLHLSEDQVKLLGSKKAFFKKQISDLKARKKAEAARAKKVKKDAQKAKTSNPEKPDAGAKPKTEKTE